MNKIIRQAFIAGCFACVGSIGLIQELLEGVPVIHPLTLDWVPLPIRIFLETGLVIFACALFKKSKQQHADLQRFANAAWTTAEKYIQKDPQWKIWHPEPGESTEETLQRVIREDAEEAER